MTFLSPSSAHTFSYKDTLSAQDQRALVAGRLASERPSRSGQARHAWASLNWSHTPHAHRWWADGQEKKKVSTQHSKTGQLLGGPLNVTTSDPRMLLRTTFYRYQNVTGIFCRYNPPEVYEMTPVLRREALGAPSRWSVNSVGFGPMKYLKRRCLIKHSTNHVFTTKETSSHSWGLKICISTVSKIIVQSTVKKKS